MKEIEVQTENEKKEIINSSVIKVDENNRIKVIITVYKPLTRDKMKELHDSAVKAFEKDNNIITIPDWIKINTIKI